MFVKAKDAKDGKKKKKLIERKFEQQNVFGNLQAMMGVTLTMNGRMKKGKQSFASKNAVSF